MKIKRFLKAFSVILLLFVVVESFQSCGNRDAVPRVDFYLDLTQAPYTVLDNIGGSVITNGVIVAYSTKGYVALSGYCTYDNTPLNFLAPYTDFACPSCQSRFYTTGAVEFGPATVPLIQYATQLNGQQLQVYTP